MIRSKSSITLAVKVLLPIFIGSFLILAVGGLYLKVHFEREITLQIRQRAESIAKSINQFAQIDPLSSRLQRFLVAMSKDEEIEAIAIVGHLPQIAILMTDGSEIMKSNQSFENSVDSYIGGEEFFQKVKEGKAAYGILENMDDSDHDFLYVFPTHIKSPKDGKDITASIFIQIEATPLIHGFERQLIRSAMFLVLGMLFLGLLNYNVFNFYVFQPVQNIKQAINRRARGDTTAYATQLPGDEIGEVGNALNTMLDALGANRLELIEKTNLLNAIVENMPVSFFAKDIRDNYRIIFWNKKSEELFGIQASEVLGKSDFDFFTKEIAEKYRINDMNVVSKGGIR